MILRFQFIFRFSVSFCLNFFITSGSVVQEQSNDGFANFIRGVGLQLRHCSVPAGAVPESPRQLLFFAGLALLGRAGARPKMGVRPGAPTNETIVLLNFYEIIGIAPVL